MQTLSSLPSHRKNTYSTPSPQSSRTSPSTISSFGREVSMQQHKAYLIHDYRLKPLFSEITNAFSADKSERLRDKIGLLSALKFPIKNEKSIEELFNQIKQIKKKSCGVSATYTFDFQGKPCELDIIPFPDGGKIRHELVVSFPFPEDEDRQDPEKHIQRGTFKDVSYAWLMSKHAHKFARVVTNFNSEGMDNKDLTKIETLYLNKFNNTPGFPKFYKSFDLLDDMRNIIYMKAYSTDLYYRTGAENGPISDSKRLEMVIQIFSILETMHSFEVGHRDIKIENFLVDEQDNLTICDFGFARSPENFEETDEDLGTIIYMPWERLSSYFYPNDLPPFYSPNENSSDLVLASDVWSAGLLALYLLWNIPLHHQVLINHKNLEPAAREKAINAVQQKLRKLSSNQPNANDQLTYLIWQTLHYFPSQRPKAHQVVAKLKEIQQSCEDKETFKIPKEDIYWTEIEEKLEKLNSKVINKLKLTY